MQVNEPTPDWYWPARQLVHEEEAPNCPAAQSLVGATQVLAPVVVIVEHATQLEDPDAAE